jgi:hypothetical protein
MNYFTYFEIRGQVIESEVSSNSSVPPVKGQVSQRAVRNGQAERSKAASPKAFHQPAYTIGVGQGNPLFWLASAALIKGAQILSPETISAV